MSELLHDQLASGVIDFLILRVLHDGESYGYEITLELGEHGLKDVREATVYTSLKRLEKLGCLASRQATADNGRQRRYYAITRKGETTLDAGIEEWHRLSAVVHSVLTTTAVRNDP